MDDRDARRIAREGQFHLREAILGPLENYPEDLTLGPTSEIPRLPDAGYNATALHSGNSGHWKQKAKYTNQEASNLHGRLQNQRGRNGPCEMFKLCGAKGKTLFKPKFVGRQAMQLAREVRDCAHR